MPRMATAAGRPRTDEISPGTPFAQSSIAHAEKMYSASGSTSSAPSPSSAREPRSQRDLSAPKGMPSSSSGGARAPPLKQRTMPPPAFGGGERTIPPPAVGEASPQKSMPPSPSGPRQLTPLGPQSEDLLLL